jgi:AcrR family transcriptional regulator
LTLCRLGGMTSARTDGKTRAPRRAGRPRLDADPQIFDAALSLLAEQGFSRLTMGGIAERAGLSKPAVYRRWAGKADLVAAAIAHSHRNRPAPTGQLRADLLAELRDVRATYETTVPMAMIGTLLAEESHHPELIDAWRRWVVAPRRGRVEEIVRRGVETGELPAGTDPGLLATMLVGAYYGAYTQGDPLPRDWENGVVSTLLDGARAREE